ncbi:MAG: metallophosphoesterase [Verrucomicrobiota bacterium]
MSAPSCSRRHLLQATLACAASTPLRLTAETAKPASTRGFFAIDDIKVRLHSPSVQQPLRVCMIADTHLFRDDQRGETFQSFSARMARAYNHTKDFRTGTETNPEESFVKTLQTAKKNNVDLLALVGDIFSFPSEDAIEWVQARLAECGLPFLYIAGNHDWHYEGMEGSLEQLRATWTEKRLKPLYQAHHPLMAMQEIRGVRFIAIDNSTYEILPEQLAFFQAQVTSGVPLVLFVHIPLYAPGRPIGFGCGHPLWGAATDKGFQTERRPRWPANGHSQVTMDFHHEVFSAPNLLGIFAGHTHQPSLDAVNGIPHIVAGPNFNGAYIDLNILPVPPV